MNDPLHSERRLPRFAVLLFAVILIGCGGPTVVPNTPLTIADVPPAVLTAAKKRFPDANVTTACKTPAGTFELYSQTKRGKLHLLVLTETGEVLEAE